MSLPPVLAERLRLPVVGSPMFIVSGPELVIEQCKAGIVGSFPSLNARPQSQLREWLTRIRDELAAYDAEHPEAPSAPFAVNLIVHRSNDRLAEDLATVVEFEVPIVITSLGAREDVNEAVHSYGGIVLHDVINNVFAHKAIDKGADGLIAVCAGAGGHAGVQSPFAFVQEIREWFDGPLLLSGSIAHGRSVLAAQAIGADLAYIGSAFIATEEANAVGDYKELIVDSGAADIVYSSYFTGVNGNYLRGSISRAGMDPDDLPESDPSSMDFGTGEAAVEGSDPVVEGAAASSGAKAKPWKDIWGSGQGIGVIREVVPVAQRVAELERQYREAKERLDVLTRPFVGDA